MTRSIGFIIAGMALILSLFILVPGGHTNALFARENATRSAASAASSTPRPAQAPFDARQANALQTAWAKHLGAKIELPNSQGTNMVLLPPGAFQMGSSPTQVAAAVKMAERLKVDDSTLKRVREAEQPRHLVIIGEPFRVAATEVTIEQFGQFVKATGYVPDAKRYGSGNSGETDPKLTKQGDPFDFRFPGFKQGENHAVSQVSWNDAVAFCNWLSGREKRKPAYQKDSKYGWKLVADAPGYRLPTEAEWEYAARAGSVTQYHFGDDAQPLSKYAWFGFKSGSTPVRTVGSKLPNPFGLYDMHGNIGEWCEDFYDPRGYPKHSVTQPSARASATQRVIRGGDWWTNAIRCRSAFRGYGEQVTRSDDLGFRLARDESRIRK